MKNRNQRWPVFIISGAAMLCLILDRETMYRGAMQGVDICIHTIIPTLFPYIFLSSVLSNILIGAKIPIIRKIGVLCGVPTGAESLLLLGLIGGYPVGAKLIGDSYHCGQLDKQTARRMLGFCNNAGPSFLFGILSPMFSKKYIPLILWAVHIFSALLTGMLLPGKRTSRQQLKPSAPVSAATVLQQSVKSLGSICGWVFLFRLMLAYCERWFLPYLPVTVRVILSGLCELANGCLQLQSIESEAVRLAASAVLLACGGICVCMQTRTVAKGLHLGMYLVGKLLQTGLSLVLIAPVCYLIDPSFFKGWFLYLWIFLIITICIYALAVRKQKKL